MKNKILVTGATGGLGSKVVGYLKEKDRVDNLTVLLRNQENQSGEKFAKDGIAVKFGDYTDLESLKIAFKGIDVLYFVSAGDDDRRTLIHKNVVDAAKDAGIKHIVYTSGVKKENADSSPLARLIDSHVQTENAILSSGINYTIVRHNLYVEVIGMMIGDKSQLLKTKVIYLPTANGASSFVPKKDIAEAEAKILLTPSRYVNKILEFNGSEQMNFSGIAKKISEIVMEPIQFVSPTITEFESTMNKIGLPKHIIEILTSFSLAIAHGEFDQQSNDIEDVLGRKTTSLFEYLQETYS